MRLKHHASLYAHFVLALVFSGTTIEYGHADTGTNTLPDQKTVTVKPGDVVIVEFDPQTTSGSWSYMRVIQITGTQIKGRSIEPNVAIPDPDYSAVSENGSGTIMTVSAEQIVNMTRLDKPVFHDQVVGRLSFLLSNDYAVVWNANSGKHIAIPNYAIKEIGDAVHIGAFNLAPRAEVLLKDGDGLRGPYAFVGSVDGDQERLVVVNRDLDTYSPQSYKIVHPEQIAHVKIRMESYEDRYVVRHEAPDQRPSKAGGIFRELATGLLFRHTGPFGRDGQPVKQDQLVPTNLCHLVSIYGDILVTE